MKYIVTIIYVSILIVPMTVSAEDKKARISNLKSFFTSSQQRAELDRLRLSGQFGSKNISQSSTTTVRKPLEVKLNGVVYSETGKPVIWVNNRSTLKSESIDETIRVKSSALKTQSTKVPVKVNQQWLKMKPGQTWRESHNQVQENYQIKESN